MAIVIWVMAIALILAPSAASAAPLLGLFLPASLGALVISPLLSNILVSVGLNLAASAFAQKPKSANTNAPAPSIASAQVNIRIETPERWQLGGRAAAGGAVGLFGEHDASGNFWYIVAHGDAELVSAPAYILDGIPVTLSDGSGGFDVGDVITADFCLTDNWAQYEGTGTQIPVFKFFTVTPDASNVYGALPGEFTAAFPALPADFHLAGVCFTIVVCRSITPAHRATAMRWRGALGLGEPSVVMVGNFNRMYDPRNGAHDVNDSTTWTAGNGNTAIVAAWFKTAPYGQNRPMAEVAWDQIALQANICDITVLNRDGIATPLYRAGVAFPDSKARGDCMRDILETANAINCYDADGKWYPKVGYYEAPTLTFSAARDILSAQTQITDDGEASLDGVVVYYIDPDQGYTRQPCAPWQNPDWFNASAIPNYYTDEILGCQDHNQAVRLAKAIGTTIAATRRAALGVTIKGILATRERGILLDYDAEFQGPHEIVGPVEQDPSGMACGFTVVPLPLDKWYLQPGEEGLPPAVTPSLGLTDDLLAPTGVVLTSDGAQIKAVFSAPARADRQFRFRYRLAASADAHQYFDGDMVALAGFSAVVTNGATYEVSNQARTSSGRETAWSALTNVLIQSNAVAPVALVSSGATGAIGQIETTFITANDANQFAVAIYRGATTVFGAAVLQTTVYAGANVSSSNTETGVTPGTWYIWAVPQNNSAIDGTASGPFTVTVT